MTIEEIILPQTEEYDFVFTQAELNLVREANLKPARGSLVVMAIGLGVALVLLWAQWISGLAGGLLLGMMIYGCLFSLISINHSKKLFRESAANVLGNRYHYCVHGDHVILTIYRDQIRYADFRIDYSELKTVLDAGSHYIYAYNNGAHLIPKARLQSDSPFADALRDKVAAQKPAGKGYRVLAAVSMWAALLGTSAAVLLISWIPGLEEDFFGQAKLMLAFLPLPILSIILGIALSKKVISWKRNVIFGAITAMMLLLFTGLNFLGGVMDAFNSSREVDTTYLEQAEDTLSIDFPEPEMVNNYEYEPQEFYAANGQLRYYCYCWFSEENTPQFAQQIVNDERWIDRVATTLQGLLPPGTYLYEGERLLLYNMDTEEYNCVPAQPGTYRFLCVICDPASGDMSIYEYEIEYIS